MLKSFLSQQKQVVIHAIGFVLRSDRNSLSAEKEKGIKEVNS